MESCQCCGRKIGMYPRYKTIPVTVEILHGINREWSMCEICADSLQKVVLCFMGETVLREPRCMGELVLGAAVNCDDCDLKPPERDCPQGIASTDTAPV